MTDLESSGRLKAFNREHFSVSVDPFGGREDIYTALQAGLGAEKVESIYTTPQAGTGAGTEKTYGA